MDKQRLQFLAGILTEAKDDVAGTKAPRDANKYNVYTHSGEWEPEVDPETGRHFILALDTAREAQKEVADLRKEIEPEGIHVEHKGKIVFRWEM